MWSCDCGVVAVVLLLPSCINGAVTVEMRLWSCGAVWLGLVRFGSVWLGLVRFGSVALVSSPGFNCGFGGAVAVDLWICSFGGAVAVDLWLWVALWLWICGAVALVELWL